MKKDLKFYLNKLTAYKSSIKTYLGETYMVVPVVMMTEGVRTGAGETGSVLYTEDELERTVDSWNGAPIVINHPQNKRGDYITVNTPKGIEKHAIGRVFNAHVINKKLKGECWINVDRIKQVSNRAWNYLKEGKQLEVSIGALIQDNAESGKFSGKKYESVARNMIADHLALLPNDEGACNWKDGCGIRANKRKKQVNEKVVMKRTKKKVKVSVSPCVKNRVTGLIANKATKFKEEDRPWMEKLSENELGKLDPKKVKKVKKVKTEPVMEKVEKRGKKVKASSRKKVENKKPLTVEKYLAKAPAEVKDQVLRGLATNRAARKSLMKSIVANSTNKKTGKAVWDKATLKTQSTEALEKLDKSLKLNTKPKAKKKKVNNYAPQAASYKSKKDEGEFLFPSDVKFAKNKKKK